MREVITLQFGQLANFVGTHFWNTQEEYFNYGPDQDNLPPTQLEHDVLYRAGFSSTGVETYTPRVLVYDLKGGFGSLNKYNALFAAQDETSAPVNWDQDVSRVVSERYPKNKYQQQLEQMEHDPNFTIEPEAIASLDSSVQTWSDFNRLYYHPRSMNQVTTHQMDDSIKPYDVYTVGRQSYADYERETETFEDNFRRFAEECDNLQGFQIFASVDDAFGGFTEGMMHDIRDDYAKTPVMIYGLQSSNVPMKERSRHIVTLNRALAMTRLMDLSSTYIPLLTPSPNQIRNSGLAPYLKPNCHLMYHSSAILAAAIETVSLSYRMKHHPGTMADLTGKLNGQGSTKLGGLAVALPLPFSKDGFSATVEQLHDKIAPMLDLTTMSSKNSPINVFAEDVVVRGLPRSTVHSNDQGLYEYTRSLYHKFPQSEPQFLDNLPFPLPSSYPHLFSSLLNDNGYISQQAWPSAPSSVPVLTRLYTGAELSPEIKRLTQQFGAVPYKQMMEYSEGDYGLSQSDFMDIKEDLLHLSDVYSDEVDDFA